MHFPPLFLVVFNDCQRMVFLAFINEKTAVHILTCNLDINFQNLLSPH